MNRGRRRPVLCVAHVTNTMGRAAADFEKGESDGVFDALGIIAGIRRAWERRADAMRPRREGRTS